jgi:hypothetical protein
MLLNQLLLLGDIFSMHAQQLLWHIKVIYMSLTRFEILFQTMSCDHV